MHRVCNIPVPVSDGAVLSADLTVPGDRDGPVTEPLPVVVNFTPYNKILHRRAGSRRLRTLANRIGASDRSHFTGRDLLAAPAGGGLAASVASPSLIKRGYAYLMVDVRGTGTSTGTWDFFSEREQRDYLEVLDWARRQPWCTGQVAVTGLSYGALAALITAGRRPAGLAAVVAIEGGEDPVRELGLTGGVPSPLMGVWLGVVNVLKWAPSIRALIGTGTWRRFLRDRLTAPATWLWHAVRIALADTHPDVFLNAMWAGKLARIDDITAPTWIHGGWHDVYNRSNFRLYERIATAPGAKQVVVDDSYHNAAGSGFGAPDAPQHLDELQCAWFDRWVKGIDNGIDDYGPITVRRLGAGWVARKRYPDPVATPRRFYLCAEVSGSARHAGVDAALTGHVPEVQDRIRLPTGRSSIRSNNTAIISTGLATLLGRSFGSDDHRAETAAATFTTEPFGVAVSRTSFPRHFFSRSQRRKIKGQAIVIDPAHPSYLACLAATRLGERTHQNTEHTRRDQ